MTRNKQTKYNYIEYQTATVIKKAVPKKSKEKKLNYLEKALSVD